MKKIYAASNITEAQIIRGLLEANAIEAYAGGFYLQGGIGELPASDFANIFVNEQDMDKALEIIQQYENNTYNTDN